MSDGILQQQMELRKKINKDKRKLEHNLKNIALVEKEIQRNIERINAERKKYGDWAKYFGNDARSKQVLNWFNDENKKLELKMQRVQSVRKKILVVQKTANREAAAVDTRIAKLRKNALGDQTKPGKEHLEKQPGKKDLSFTETSMTYEDRTENVSSPVSKKPISAKKKPAPAIKNITSMKKITPASEKTAPTIPEKISHYSEKKLINEKKLSSTMQIGDREKVKPLIVKPDVTKDKNNDAKQVGARRKKPLDISRLNPGDILKNKRVNVPFMENPDQQLYDGSRLETVKRMQNIRINDIRPRAAAPKVAEKKNISYLKPEKNFHSTSGLPDKIDIVTSKQNYIQKQPVTEEYQKAARKFFSQHAEQNISQPQKQNAPQPEAPRTAHATIPKKETSSETTDKPLKIDRVSKSSESKIIKPLAEKRTWRDETAVESGIQLPGNRSRDKKNTNTQSEKQLDILYLGIDLGTCQTTVCSSSGRKFSVKSAIGWPKDIISRKLLGKEVLFGEEALKNKLALNLYRPLEYGVIKNTNEDLEAARELIKYVLSRVSSDDYKKIYAVIGAPAEVSFKNEQTILDAASDIVDSAIIVSEPFVVAYGENNVYNTLVIDIGAGTTDICCLKGTFPQKEDQITLNKAGDYIDLQLQSIICERLHGAQVTRTMVQRWKETFSFVMQPHKPAVVEIAVLGKPLKIDITNCIQQSCEAIVADIVENVKKLIASYDPEFQSVLKQNIILAGGGSLIRNLDTFLERKLSSLGQIKIRKIDNPFIAGAHGALALARDVTDDFWKGI